MRIQKPKNFQFQKITISGSKSESNRALIIQALSSAEISIQNLSNAKDTRIIADALKNENMLIDCEQSGAAIRFLCAYFASTKNKTVILTGSQRLKERPLKILIDALKELGAEIEYLEKTGFAPIKIRGKELVSHYPITIQANVSSQFISALLMIAPRIKNGLQLHLENKIISESYIKMTMQLMHDAKIHIIENESSIIIPEQEYEQCHYNIEPDWSSASYLYNLVALGIPEIQLYGFKKNSTQGDSIISEWYRNWGVETIFEEDGIRLKHTGNFNPLEIYDFSNCPDLAQSLVVLAMLKRIPIKFKGIESLAIKETDRISALEIELKKFSTMMQKTNKYYELNFLESSLPSAVEIETYHDHRMAMAFACTAMHLEQVDILNPEVVSKSYPNYWNDLESLGFSLARNNN